MIWAASTRRGLFFNWWQVLQSLWTEVKPTLKVSASLVFS